MNQNDYYVHDDGDDDDTILYFYDTIPLNFWLLEWIEHEYSTPLNRSAMLSYSLRMNLYTVKRMWRMSRVVVGFTIHIQSESESSQSRVWQ